MRGALHMLRVLRPVLLVVGIAVALAVPLVVGARVLATAPAPGPLTLSGGVPRPAAAAEPAGRTPEDYTDWAGRVGATTGIPARALQAYAHATDTLAAEQPGCRLGWTTLAGIGRVESDHGRYGDRVLGADGRPDRPIIGIALDGGPAVAAIADSDAGALDGDRTWDRAVGPMQFIPTTWASERADGDRDGVADPQDVDDAALAAGRYLCAGGGDLRTGQAWWRAVLRYNASTEYAEAVLAGADLYAEKSLLSRPAP